MIGDPMASALPLLLTLCPWQLTFYSLWVFSILRFHMQEMLMSISVTGLTYSPNENIFQVNLDCSKSFAQLSYVAQFLYPFNHWECLGYFIIWLLWIMLQRTRERCRCFIGQWFWFCIGDIAMYTKGLLNLYGTSIINFFGTTVLVCIMFAPIHILNNNVQESHIL